MVQELNSSKKKAFLVLEDGTLFTGIGFGAAMKTSGEVVFSTGMVGYPEALTDPSYKGQILNLTYPLVGNYGVPSNDLSFGLPLYFESNRIQTSGLIIHELCTEPYHWASKRTLDKWLQDEGIPGISGIDTRRLTKKLRTHGVMLGILQVCEADEEPNVDALLKEAGSIPDPNLTDLVKEVSVKEPVSYNVDGMNTAVLIDTGVKNNIIRNFLKRGINVVRVPYDFSAKEILEYKPNGVIISKWSRRPQKVRCNCPKREGTRGEKANDGHLPWKPDTHACHGRRHIQTEVRSPQPKPARTRPQNETLLHHHTEPRIRHRNELLRKNTARMLVRERGRQNR